MMPSPSVDTISTKTMKTVNLKSCLKSTCNKNTYLLQIYPIRTIKSLNIKLFVIHLPPRAQLSLIFLFMIMSAGSHIHKKLFLCVTSLTNLHPYTKSYLIQTLWLMENHITKYCHLLDIVYQLLYTQHKQSDLPHTFFLTQDYT